MVSVIAGPTPFYGTMHELHAERGVEVMLQAQ